MASWGGSAITLEQMVIDDDDAASDEKLMELIKQQASLVIPAESEFKQAQEQEESDLDSSDDDACPLTGTELTRQWKKAVSESAVLKNRLIRRSTIMEEMRKSYLIDIVCMKNVLNALNKPDLAEIMHVWNTSIPSLDLRQSLEMHTPELAHLSIDPCKRCGGQMNVVFHNSYQVEELLDKVKAMKQQYSELQVQSAGMIHMLSYLSPGPQSEFNCLCSKRVSQC